MLFITKFIIFYIAIMLVKVTLCFRYRIVTVHNRIYDFFEFFYVRTIIYLFFAFIYCSVSASCLLYWVIFIDIYTCHPIYLPQ